RIVYAGITELNVLVGRVRLFLEGRRAKQQRHEVVAKSRSKPRLKPPRIEPTLERVETSVRVERERQVPLFEPEPVAAGELPPLSLLDDPPQREGGYSSEALEGMSRLVEIKLADFGIEVEVVA